MDWRVLTGVVTSVVTGAAVTLPPAHGQLEPTRLAVTISGLDEPQGQVCLNLFDSGAGFPSDRAQAVATQCLETSPDLALVAIFEDLAPGSYAVSAFHDANGDSEFNRNFVGMPAEGFGFSRNPDALTGAPDFGEAMVLVAGGETNIEIELTYF